MPHQQAQRPNKLSMRPTAPAGASRLRVQGSLPSGFAVSKTLRLRFSLNRRKSLLEPRQKLRSKPLHLPLPRVAPRWLGGILPKAKTSLPIQKLRCSLKVFQGLVGIKVPRGRQIFCLAGMRFRATKTVPTRAIPRTKSQPFESPNARRSTPFSALLPGSQAV